MADTDVDVLPPLTPPGGGHTIAMSGLERADIIVSTTPKLISKLIRVGTLSPVSHAILYVGDGMVVEAIGAGLVSRSLEEALSDANLAVAYRCPVLSRAGQRRIVSWALQQAKGKLEYSHGKIAILANPKMRHLCGIVSAVRTEFICSEFVIEAYRQADCPITTQPAACVSPDDVLEIARERLVYVGHLRGDLLKRSRTDVARQSHLGRYGE